MAWRVCFSRSVNHIRQAPSPLQAKGCTDIAAVEPEAGIDSRAHGLL